MIFYCDIVPYNEDSFKNKSFEEKLQNWGKEVDKKFEEKKDVKSNVCFPATVFYSFEDVSGVVTIAPTYLSVTQKTKTSKGETLYFLKNVCSITIRNKNEKESLIDLNFDSRTETLPVLLEPYKAEIILEQIKRNLNNASR